MASDRDEALISEDEVRHVALLSRLEVDDERLARFTRELNDILAHMTQLGEIDTADVDPTSHAIARVNVLREDVPGQSLSNEAALANAADTEGPYFKVPKIIQEE